MPAQRDERSKARPPQGLHTEINPALLSANSNLIRKQYRGQNPYLSAVPVSDAKTRKRYERGLKFHEKGEISAAIERERATLRDQEEKRQQRLQLEAQRQEQRKILVAQGELPDTSIGEEKYLPGEVPDVEWWDRIFLDEQLQILPKYLATEEVVSSDEEDEHPSIRYVEHPVPVRTDTAQPVAKVYLTEREQKKMRRNRRKLQRETKETRIKMGLDPKPEPKVGLKNMMSVYENNENVTDPTSWEHSVRQQVELRRQRHEATNVSRHEEALENRRRERLAQLPVQDARDARDARHRCCKVFWFQSLGNPRIRHKVKTNASQLSLRGLCLRVGERGSGIIVVVGKEKACKFYDRLLTRRIRWDEPYEDPETHEAVDASGNRVEKTWQGELKDCAFGPFFMKMCRDEDEMRQLLRQRDAEHLLSSVI